VSAITRLKISSSDFGYTNESHEADRQDMGVVGISTRAWIALHKGMDCCERYRRGKEDPDLLQTIARPR
jgi:hypothetical protein